MGDARKRAEKALRMFDQTATPEPHEVYLYRAIAALREILAEEAPPAADEDERWAVAAEIAGLPVHFVAHLPRGRVFMHPDTPKSGARDAWPPPIPSMIPVPIAPAPAPCSGCGGLGWIPAGDEQLGCIDCNGTGTIAPAPPDATEHPCGCSAPEGDHCHRHPAPPAADEVWEAAEAFRALLLEPGDLDYPVEDVYSEGPGENAEAPFWSEAGLYGRVGKEAARTLLARHRRATKALSALAARGGA